MAAIVPNSLKDMEYYIKGAPYAVVYPTHAASDLVPHVNNAMKQLGSEASRIIIWDVNKFSPRPNSPFETLHVPHLYSQGVHRGVARLKPSLNAEQVAEAIVGLASRLAVTPVPLPAPL